MDVRFCLSNQISASVCCHVNLTWDLEHSEVLCGILQNKSVDIHFRLVGVKEFFDTTDRERGWFGSICVIVKSIRMIEGIIIHSLLGDRSVWFGYFGLLGGKR